MTLVVGTLEQIVDQFLLELALLDELNELYVWLRLVGVSLDGGDHS
jgi:hypothetical protein